MPLQKGYVGKSVLIYIERWYHKILIGVRMIALTVLDQALQVVLCEHRHILGQGVYVLPAPYLWPIHGGCTENHVTSITSQASCILYLFLTTRLQN